MRLAKLQALGVVVAVAVATLSASTPPASAASAASAAPVVRVHEGALRGRALDGVDSFLGIRYAAAPSGSRRWAPPTPAASWSGVRGATTWGARCPQLASTNGPRSTTEDCLVVNVQRPSGARADADLPVYVFIHGGGLMNGASDQMDGSQFVERSGAVVVTFNYRLGALGFLATAQLDGRRGDGGNYGFQDQQLALRWVQRNIAAFGGDPGAVTIGGESAGGWSVCAHLTAPGSRGLFAAAMIQSGSCFSLTRAEAEAKGRTVAAGVGCPAADTRCLRRVPVARLLNAGMPGGFAAFMAGTPSLPTAPQAAVRSGAFARVPVVVGANRDEGRTFAQGNVGWTRSRYESWIRATFAGRAPLVLRQYPWPATSDRFTGAYLSGAILTDSGAIAGIGGCSNRALVQNLNRWTTTYAYEFDHRTGPGLTPQPTGYVWGAGHAAELAYVWPSFNNGTSIAARFSGAEKQLSREMTAYWAGFVSGHEPRAEGLPRWPTADDGDVMSLHAGGASTVVSDDDVAREHRCTFWAGPVT